MNSLLASLCVIAAISTTSAQIFGGFGNAFGNNFGSSIGSDFGVFAGNRFGNQVQAQDNAIKQANTGLQAANQDQEFIKAGTDQGERANAGLKNSEGQRVLANKAVDFAEQGGAESFVNNDVKVFDKGQNSIKVQLEEDAVRSNGVAVSLNDGNVASFKSQKQAAENLEADEFFNLDAFSNFDVFDKNFLNAGVADRDTVNAFDNRNEAQQTQLAADSFKDANAKAADTTFGEESVDFFNGGFFGK